MVKIEQTMKKNDSFERSDALVFTSLFGYGKEVKPFMLKEIIGRGDLLNRAILTPGELLQGFEKLITGGLIHLTSNGLNLTPIGCSIKEQVINKKGGLFSMIDYTLQQLNSPSFTLENSGKIDIELSKVLSEENVQKAYEAYAKKEEKG